MKQLKKQIFAIGIGGSGLSGLAKLLAKMGNSVSGSDANISLSREKELKKHKVAVYETHNATHITSKIDTVIYSQAIDEKNVELVKAKQLKIRTLTYPQAIGEYLFDKTKICVAGTHGKTTTTGMIAAVLLAAKKDPTVIVGSEVKELGGQNSHLGKSDLAVIETCEYKKSFHDIPPNLLVITNIDFDHVDYYKTQANYDAAFEKYIKMVPIDGAIFYLKEDKKAAKLVKKATCKNIYPIETQKIDLKIPGQHNQKNASLALALATHLGVSNASARKTLSTFSGTKRRLEFKGTYKKAKIYDDYGHHPTEIKATLSALRELYPTQKILTIFQPHQFSRTKAFLADFATAFSQTDKLIIPNIYEARDTAKDKHSINLTKLVAAINTKQPHKAINGHNITKTLLYTRTNAPAYDIIITMGAGNVYQISDLLVHE